MEAELSANSFDSSGDGKVSLISDFRSKPILLSFSTLLDPRTYLSMLSCNSSTEPLRFSMLKLESSSSKEVSVPNEVLCEVALMPVPVLLDFSIMRISSCKA